mgnify:FL=1
MKERISMFLPTEHFHQLHGNSLQKEGEAGTEEQGNEDQDQN